MRFALLIAFSLCISLLAATGSIAGKVVSGATGEGLAGISVILEESGTGVITNQNGGYIIKNLPDGQHTLSVSVIGYESQKAVVRVQNGQTTINNFRLTVKPFAIEGFTVSANMAVKRETPIAFSTIGESQLEDKYTTQDIPQLMDDVPGLFSSSLGLGESEITMRGFDADKVQILINGIPVNDPESQQVYWSNWTGLSSNVKSVQVQRGAGSSLYGSGAFGGSVNIETMGSTVDREIEVRSSVGAYRTTGKVANAKGGMKNYDPINYNVSVRFKSGMLYNGKFNYSLMAERKAGDSYVIGTNYDGWSFGAEAATLLGAHSLNYSFIAAPQEHNQARKTTDMYLTQYLGREYNRNNCAEQENYYFKPQFSIRDEWTISPTQSMMTNAFITMGQGGGKYLYNDSFDGDVRGGRIPTGEVGYQETSYKTDNKYFGRHARWIYDTTGYLCDGCTYDEDTDTFTYMGWDPDTGSYTDDITVRSSENLVTDTYDNSWLNNAHNDHLQFGLNSYYEQKLFPGLQVTLGGEARYWKADHYAESSDFRYYNVYGIGSDSVSVYSQVQDRYNYTTLVANLSGFMRFGIRPLPMLNIVADGQYALYHSEVEENPIDIFDFRSGQFTGRRYYSSKNMVDDDGNLLFDDDDYKKTFRFFSPKLGVNCNLSSHLNVMANFSIAYKEPKTSQWYSSSSGPNSGQTYTEDGVEHTYKLKPERATTIEGGLGYTDSVFDANVNYYITKYDDKIESVEDEHYGSITMNAGRARHMGWELSAGLDDGFMDLSASATLSQNRWRHMNVDQIFGTKSENVIGKVVPFSPEKMMNLSQGFTFRDLPGQGKFRIGWSYKWWAEYYGNWTNSYEVPVYNEDGSVSLVVKKARLPWFNEADVDMKYDFKLYGKAVSLKLDLNNIFDNRNNTAATWSSDYGTNNPIMNGKKYMYVTVAPRFNVFFTTTVNF